MKRKIALILVVCLMLIALASCGGADLTALEERIGKLEEQNAQLQEENSQLRGRVKELEKRTTVFYDWDNPIIVSLEELMRNEYDNYFNLYYNRVIQITGIVFGKTPGGRGLNVRNSEWSAGITCLFLLGVNLSDYVIDQVITLKGVAGGGFNIEETNTIVRNLYFCEVV